MSTQRSAQPSHELGGGNDLVIVSKQRLVGATNGSSTYLIAIAESLRGAGFRVHLIQPSPTVSGRMPFIKMRSDMDVFDSHVLRGATRIGSIFVFHDLRIWGYAAAGIVKRLLRRVGLTGAWTSDRPRPYAVATPWLEEDKQFLQRHLPAGAKAIIADYMFCSPAFDLVPPHWAKAIVMHDLFHARDGGSDDSVALVSQTDELAMLSKADTVFTIQKAENDFVQNHVDGAQALLVPMPATPAQKAAVGEDDRLLFVGSNTAPNSVGLTWFLREIWLTVLAARPNCQLDVAGTVRQAMDGGLHKQVHFHGMVDDLDDFYSRAGVVISPLTFGSGLKIKLIEAMAKGKAIVATPVTLQGVETVCETAVMSSDNPRVFAEHIIELAGDETKRRVLAQAALGIAIDHFSAAAAHKSLLSWADDNAAN